MDRFIGRMLDDRYEILEVIGTGGMAVVYKARCHRLNRLVAIKILKDENLEDADFRRRFRAEGQAVGMLNHPNIVAVYDVVTSKEADYIVMELIEGISLKQYMEKKGVLNWKETLHFATQIAKALEHAHSKGLVHRDIKPHNVMVLKNGSVRVTDFGIARVTSKASTVTKEALGSVHYISPEQARGGRVDCRSDLYSLGVVMYEMITGRPPFDGDSPVTVALQHIAGGATKPSVLNPNVPAGLEQIILKAMAHEPKDRYANVAALLADLDAVREDPTIILGASAEKAPKSRPPRPEKEPQQTVAQKTAEPKPVKSREERALDRNRITTVVIVLCALAVMAGALIFLVSGMATPQETKPQMVQVPAVMGLHFERLPDYSGVEIVLQDSAYSDEYGKGVIMRQLPEAKKMVPAGTKVYVVVSLGKKPDTVVMPDLMDMTEVEARARLTGLNMGLKIVTRTQTHETVAKGYVFSVIPSQGTQLRKGDTVTIYISEGRDVRTAIMPNLIQGGANTKAAAEAEMRHRGFTNVKWVPVESNQPEGKILSQSVPADETVDVNAPIIIEYAVKPQSLSKMPALVGLNLETAKMRMDMLGFTHVKWVEVDDIAQAGTVLRQSEQDGEMVGTATEITVEYSNGMLVKYTFENLPVSVDGYTITIWHAGKPLLVDQAIQPGETSYTMVLRRGERYTVWTTAYGQYKELRTYTVPLTDAPEEPEPTDPVEPTDPTEPIAPTDPTQPSQPEGTEPQPSEPQQPEMDQGNDGQ